MSTYSNLSSTFFHVIHKNVELLKETQKKNLVELTYIPCIQVHILEIGKSIMYEKKHLSIPNVKFVSTHSNG